MASPLDVSEESMNLLEILKTIARSANQSNARNTGSERLMATKVDEQHRKNESVSLHLSLKRT